MTSTELPVAKKRRKPAEVPVSEEKSGTPRSAKMAPDLVKMINIIVEHEDSNQPTVIDELLRDRLTARYTDVLALMNAEAKSSGYTPSTR